MQFGPICRPARFLMAPALGFAHTRYAEGMSETDLPSNPEKRRAMRRFAGDTIRFAGDWMPGSRLVRNWDPELFRELYEGGATRNAAVPREFTDMHGRRFFRPPGALHEDDFLDTCSRCLKCVEVCPEEIIKVAAEGDGPPEGTPHIQPNRGACTMCGDCMEACPTGALKPTPVGEIRIGIAVVEPDTCIGYQGKNCRECHDACPLEPNAIDFDATAPKVDSRICTGCGLCVEVCPTKPQSIVVLPRPSRQKRSET